MLFLFLFLCPHPVLCSVSRDDDLGPATPPTHHIAIHEQTSINAFPHVARLYRRRLKQEQADDTDDLDKDQDTKGTDTLTEGAFSAQGVEHADGIPKPNRDDGDAAAEAKDDAEVDAQIAAIARHAGITEEELNRVDVNQDTGRKLEDMVKDVNEASASSIYARDHDATDNLERSNRNAEQASARDDAAQDDGAARKAISKTSNADATNMDVGVGAKDRDGDAETSVKDARQADQAPPEMVAPGRPNQPHVLQAKNETKENSAGMDVSSLRTENENYRQRIKSLAEREQNARHNEREAKLEAERLKKEIERMKAEKTHADHFVSEQKLENRKLRESFSKSVDEAKVEKQEEMEEMKAAIEEQKQAFEELFEEKQLLSRMLSDEQRKLNELQEKIQHPDLGLWVRQRAERAAILVEGPETDAVKYYAQKYMAPKVTKMKHRLQMLENRVERSVDHLLPAKYGGFVAMLLSIGLIGFPVFVTLSTAVSLTKSFSLRQHVLVGNVFWTAFAVGLCVAGLVLRQDPLQTLYEASRSLFILLQLGMAVAYPAFLMVISCAVLRARDKVDVLVFGCELVFYAVIGMNYRSRVWRAAMLGEHIDTGPMMYAVYMVDFVAMMALTVSSSRTMGGSGMGGHDVEDGFEKLSVHSGAGRGAASARGIVSLGSGLVQLAVGGKREQKDE